MISFSCSCCRRASEGGVWSSVSDVASGGGGGEGRGDCWPLTTVRVLGLTVPVSGTNPVMRGRMVSRWGESSGGSDRMGRCR